MKTRTLGLILMKTRTLGLILTLFPNMLRAEAPPPRETIAIAHVNVIDATGAAVRPDQTVLVDQGRIRAIGTADEVTVPAEARVVDGSGKYLIPGLWDMHVHCGEETSLALFVANGVTGVRVMWGNPLMAVLATGKQIHTEWRKEIAEGRRLGPRLVVASNILDGPKTVWPGSTSVSTAAEARQAVRDAKQAGADFIKVYSLLPREAYFAIADEAKKQGLPFAGHLPVTVRAEEASSAGQKSIEHLTGLLTACSTREDELNQKRWEAAQKAVGTAIMAPAMSASLEVVLESYSAEKAQRVFATFREHRTWQCPTLTVLRAMAYLEDGRFRDDPRMKYVSGMMRAIWNPKDGFRLNAAPATDCAHRRQFYQESLKLVGRMHCAGVSFLAGTDEMNPYCFPGFSLHDELALLVEAGLSPLEALQAATRNPAEFFGWLDERGTIEKGKAADLVLLDADPLADIHNTTKIRAVILDGRWLDRAALDRLLAGAASAVSRKELQGRSKFQILLPAGYCPEHW
jgi:imidazolonepropionase-like amidohydrolase